MRDKIKHVCVAICLCLPLLLLTACQNEKKDANDWDSYMSELFEEQVTLNTLTLHYLLADPASYRIEDYEVSLGSVSEESSAESVALFESIQSELKHYRRADLSDSQRLTYDILDSYTQRELDYADMYLYSEPLTPGSGIHSELPVLLAEYTFRNRQDVEDYLQLLALVPDYFSEIIVFEGEKADAGLFMCKSHAQEVQKQCEEFAATGESNLLLSSFEDRISSMDILSQTEKASYIEENEHLIATCILPSYEMLSDAIKVLTPAASETGGLCTYENGSRYYEYLVSYHTGSDKSISSIKRAIEKERNQNITDMATLLQEHPDLLDTYASYSLPTEEPAAILEDLKKKIADDFPKLPTVNCSIKYVDSALEDYLAPAFYLTSPLDAYEENTVYINKKNGYTGLELYTTLAHEGYPGHLYQNVISCTSDIPPLRQLMNYPGYSEGWATYVEMISYEYAEVDENIAKLNQLNKAITLSLYATIDIGVHYDGWSHADVAEFLATYGLDDATAAKDVYSYISGTPANYLKYYVGYLEFLELKAYAKKCMGDAYTDKAFHEAVLNIGPAPFSLLKKYLLDYLPTGISYSSNNA